MIEHRTVDLSLVGDFALKRASLIHAGNERGKTTSCYILHSLAADEPVQTEGMRTLVKYYQSYSAPSPSAGVDHI